MSNKLIPSPSALTREEFISCLCYTSIMIWQGPVLYSHSRIPDDWDLSSYSCIIWDLAGDSIWRSLSLSYSLYFTPSPAHTHTHFYALAWKWHISFPLTTCWLNLLALPNCKGARKSRSSYELYVQCCYRIDK